MYSSVHLVTVIVLYFCKYCMLTFHNITNVIHHLNNLTLFHFACLRFPLFFVHISY